MLSGGQRQAVTIARAFLGRPPVLLMDEPTSAMDNRSEMHIKHQLAQLKPSETLILITQNVDARHRRSRDCDGERQRNCRRSKISSAERLEAR